MGIHFPGPIIIAVQDLQLRRILNPILRERIVFNRHVQEIAAATERKMGDMEIDKPGPFEGEGLPVDKAIKVLSSQAVPDTVPPVQSDFYKKQLPGAARFAYMSGLSIDGTARFYLKQCRIGS